MVVICGDTSNKRIYFERDIKQQKDNKERQLPVLIKGQTSGHKFKEREASDNQSSLKCKESKSQWDAMILPFALVDPLR